MMINSISDYIVAVGAGDRAYSNLQGVRLTVGEEGLPQMRTSSRYVELDATWHSQPCHICCPIDPSATLDAARLTAALKRVDTPLLAGYRLLHNELLIGEQLSDIVIEVLPEGEPLDRILSAGVPAKRARRLAAEWIATAEALAEIPFSHRALSTSRIIVRADGGMTLCGLHHARLESSTDDHRAIVEITYQILQTAIPNAVYPPIVELLTTADRTELCARLRIIAGEAKVQTAKRPNENIQQITRKLLDCIDFSNREWIGIVTEDRIAFREGERYGYLDMLNNVIIEPQFTRVEPFHEGRAVVETSAGAGLINKQGAWIIAPEHTVVIWSADYNVATVLNDHGWSLYDSLGRRISRYYDYLGECTDHRIAARADGRWGYIDTHGCEVIALQYDDAYEYKNGRARVILNERPLEIDIDGLEIL